MTHITPQTLLRAYAAGVFPMSESRDDPELFWVDPRKRGVFDLDQFHVSRSLARRIRNTQITATINHNFEAVLDGCADREETWINAEIYDLYCQLNNMGFAHSQEIWSNDKLIGGVYGVVLGGAFFGESMFSSAPDGSKIALAFLIDRLRHGGFSLFDTQFITPHLASMGAQEITRDAYHQRLNQALRQDACFIKEHYQPDLDQVVQRKTHTSKRG